MSFQGGFGSNSGFNQGFGQSSPLGLGQGSFNLPSVFPSGQQSPGLGSQNFGMQGQMGGLSREGWQELVAESTGPGVNAAQAAVNLDPLYRAQRENRGGQGSFGGQGNQGQYRSNWQAAISQTTQQYGVNAAQAAQMLDPYWLGRGERVANEPGTQSSGGRNRSRSKSQNWGGYQGFGGYQQGLGMQAYNGAYGSVNQLPSVGGMQSPPKLSIAYARQLTPQIAQMYGDRIRGLSREDYQVLITDVTRQFGISAAQAAAALAPLIQGQNEVSGLSPQQWNQLISQTTQQYGVNAAQAAQILDPFVQGKREKGSQYDVSNVSVGVTQGMQGYNGGYGGYNGGYGGRNGYNGGYGGYGGRNGYGSSYNGWGGSNSSYNGWGGSYNGAYGGSRGSRRGQGNQNLLSGTGRWTNAGERSGGLESGLGMYEGLNGSRSFRSGTPAESNDVVLSFDQATAFGAQEAARSPSPLTKRSQDQNRRYFVNEEIGQIANALGIGSTGVGQVDVQNIRQAVGAQPNGGRTWG